MTNFNKHAPSCISAPTSPTYPAQPANNAPASEKITPLQAPEGTDKLACLVENTDQSEIKADTSSEYDSSAESTADQAKSAWKQHIGKTKKIWSILTEDELLQTEGDKLQLTALVQQRYGISHEFAERQVKSILDQCLLIFQLQRVCQKRV